MKRASRVSMSLPWCWYLWWIVGCQALVNRPGSSWNVYDYHSHRHPAKKPIVPGEIMVDVINDLGVKLLAIHNEYNENNIAISPYGALSVIIALGEGLQGEAVREIQHAAHIPNDISIIRIGLRDIHRHLKSYFIPREGFLAGLTLNYENVTLRPEYEEILKFYGYDIMAFNNALYPEPLTTEKPTEIPETARPSLPTTFQITTSENTTPSREQLPTTKAGDARELETVTASIESAGLTQEFSTYSAAISTTTPQSATATVTTTETPTTASKASTTPMESRTTITETITTKIEPVTTTIESATTATTLIMELTVPTESATTTEPATMTTEPATTTTKPAITTTEPATTTTESASATQEPATSTTEPATTTTELGTTKTKFDATTTEMATVTTETAITTSKFATMTTEPVITTAELVPTPTEPFTTTTELVPTPTDLDTITMKTTTTIVELAATTSGLETTSLESLTTTLEPAIMTEQGTTMTIEPVTTTQEPTSTVLESESTNPTLESTTEELRTMPPDATTVIPDTETTTLSLTTTNSLNETPVEVESTAMNELESTLEPTITDTDSSSQSSATSIEESPSSFNTLPSGDPAEATQENSIDNEIMVKDEGVGPLGFAGVSKRRARSQFNVIELNSWRERHHEDSRRPRSVVDYVIARYYDDHQFPTQFYRPFVSVDQPTFLVQGRYKEHRINFMKYDTVLPFVYIPHLDTLALSFPLDSSRYYLLLLLPRDVNGVDKLICDLRLNGSLRYIIDNLRYRHVIATIPSFTLKGYVTLTSSFQKLGIRKVFEPRQSDFSPMTDQKEIYVTNIEQAITVNIRNYVDPNSLGSQRLLRQHDTVEFRADHPFLYFVMDSELHVALMVGKVVNPLNSRIS